MNLSLGEKLSAGFVVMLLLVGLILIAVYRSGRIPETYYVTSATEAELDYPADPLNSATKEDFMNVPGIGEVKANAIIEFRTAIGGFKSVSQLKQVSGISDNLYQGIISYFYDIPAPEPETTSATSVSEDISAAPNETAETKEKEPAQTTAAKANDKKKKPIEKGTAKETQAETTAESTAAAEPEMKPVDINHADTAELSKSLLISEELAEEIVGLRGKIEYFSTVEELYLVDGMDKNTYQRIKDFILFG